MIKYRHRNCDRTFIPATFAYVLPPANRFMRMLEHSEPVINFHFGMTLLHERDQYCKATGRVMAVRDLQRGIKSFGVHHITIQNNRVYFVLQTKDTQIPLEIRVSVDFSTGKSRLEDIEFLNV